MTASKNVDQTIAQLKGAHREHDDGAEAQGYIAPGGETLATPGDEEAPFQKTPPFPEPAQQWTSDIALLESIYTTLDEVDVTNYRTITVYIELVVPTPGDEVGQSQLSLIAETLAIDDLGDSAWYVSGLVDSVVTQVTPQPPFGYVFGSREFLPAEFRTATFTGPVTVRLKLVFEVSDAIAFRISVLELTADASGQNTFSAKYSRAL
jgi:hypothetical protein